MNKEGKYGIFYKIRGKWTSKPWGYYLDKPINESPFINKSDIKYAIDVAKDELKSKISLRQYKNNRWVKI